MRIGIFYPLQQVGRVPRPVEGDLGATVAARALEEEIDEGLGERGGVGDPVDLKRGLEVVMLVKFGECLAFLKAPVVTKGRSPRPSSRTLSAR